jgi:hypothetical protein
LLKLYIHGFYERKVRKKEDCDGSTIRVLRFICASCSRTCSRLPTFLPPRRWYWWKDQQTALKLYLEGFIVSDVARQCKLHRQTVSRWVHWLEERFQSYAFSLRSRFEQLGRHDAPTPFWLACLAQMDLCQAICFVALAGDPVP